jgi:hypothetical protein
MATSTYYEDRRYCHACRRYVQYLQSPRAAFCSSCGDAVRLFSPHDLEQFRRSLHVERPPRSRPGRAARALHS